MCQTTFPEKRPTLGTPVAPMFGAETQSGKSVGKQVIVDQRGIFAKRSTKPKGNKEVDSTAKDKTHSIPR